MKHPLNSHLNGLNRATSNPLNAKPHFPRNKFLTGAVIGVAALAFLFARPASAQGKRGLYGSVPSEALRSLPVGALPQSQRLDLAISLPLRNQAQHWIWRFRSFITQPALIFING
jgi:hypothetical protein